MAACRSTLVASIVAVFVLLPGEVRAQTANPAAGTDPATFHPFDLKPGCWEVRTTTSIVGFFSHVSPDYYKFPAATPKQRADFAAGINAGLDHQNAELKKPHIQQTVGCNSSQGFQMLDLGTVVPLQNPHCTESLHSTTRERHRTKSCTADAGATSVEWNDFSSSDPEHFSGLIRVVTHFGGKREETMAWVGKWMGEGAPHMPYPTPPTDLDGKKLLGPRAVTALDPYRIVATFEGQPWIAAAAIHLFGAVPAATARKYGSRLDTVAQQIYLRGKVADDAVILNLAKKQPWYNELGAAGILVRDIHEARFNAWAWGGNPYDPLDTASGQRDAEAARQRILWDAYFSQASTPAEKQALLQKVQAKYKMTVVDPDFFAGTVDW